MWNGCYTGLKGYKNYKFLSSGKIEANAIPSAHYTKDGVFSLLYRRRCEEKPDKKEFAENVRKILDHKSRRYLAIINFQQGAATLEFYCLLPSIPTEETMNELEHYLNTGILL